MADRNFDNFRTAVTDPKYFVGRDEFIRTICDAPFQVKILLGGRRIGKTSLLRAIEWTFLNPQFNSPPRAFPVLVNLQAEQPKSSDEFRYILIRTLRTAISKWKNTKVTELRETYLYYLRQVTEMQFSLCPFLKGTAYNPDYKRILKTDDFRYILLKSINELRDDLHFNGICFLLDEAEFVVNQTWSNDVWSYIRGIKDSDMALKPFLGFVVSGYKDLKSYKQKIGSPLYNIAEVQWMSPLKIEEGRELITIRQQDEGLKLTEDDIQEQFFLSGLHPFLMQQILNAAFDRHKNKNQPFMDGLSEEMLLNQHLPFPAWWDRFSEQERKVYTILMEKRRGTFQEIHKLASLTQNTTISSLQLLEGTGVIKKLDHLFYEIGSSLFERWVRQENL
jgi:hypothetical protein